MDALGGKFCCRRHSLSWLRLRCRVLLLVPGGCAAAALTGSPRLRSPATPPSLQPKKCGRAFRTGTGTCPSTLCRRASCRSSKWPTAGRRRQTRRRWRARRRRETRSSWSSRSSSRRQARDASMSMHGYIIQHVTCWPKNSLDQMRRTSTALLARPLAVMAAHPCRSIHSGGVLETGMPPHKAAAGFSRDRPGWLAQHGGEATPTASPASSSSAEKWLEFLVSKGWTVSYYPIAVTHSGLVTNTATAALRACGVSAAGAAAAVRRVACNALDYACKFRASRRHLSLRLENPQVDPG